MPDDQTPQESPTILVVDDEPDIVEIVSEVLAAAGYRVLSAGDGQTATTVFAEHSASISAVVLDLTMPRKPGLDVLRDIRQISRDVPVVLSSGFSEDDVASQLDGLAVSVFMRKPYRFRELLAQLDALLGRRR